MRVYPMSIEYHDIAVHTSHIACVLFTDSLGYMSVSLYRSSDRFAS